MIGTVDDAVVLITGGTGSLGQTLTRRLLAGGLGRPKRIIVFSRLVKSEPRGPAVDG